jgi:L-iditol 2-dehydrogenase
MTTATLPGNQYPIPKTMRAWVLGGPEELTLVEKPVPEPGPAEVLVRIDAVAICATDLEIIRHGLPASIEGELPFNKGYTPGHEYMGTVVKLGPTVDEFQPGDRVAVEIHAGCGRCQRCREGMYTSCLNYGFRSKGHRANGFSTDGGFAGYAVNHVNTMVHVPHDMSDEEATLIVTAGTAMYGLDVLGGIIAGEGVVVIGPGPIGLMGVGVAKALGAQPVILTGTRESRLEMGQRLGADAVINVNAEDSVAAVLRITGGRGVQYVLECSGAPNALNDAARMVNRGGRICLAAFPHAGDGRPRLHRAHQYLRVRDSRRGQERDPPGRCLDGTAAVRRRAHPHPYVSTRRAAHRAAIRARSRRRCDQGRGDDAVTVATRRRSVSHRSA